MVAPGGVVFSTLSSRGLLWLGTLPTLRVMWGSCLRRRNHAGSCDTE
nr:MAG TPA: hypothetical protein [Caudoviricetes sp.]